MVHLLSLHFLLQLLPLSSFILSKWCWTAVKSNVQGYLKLGLSSWHVRHSFITWQLWGGVCYKKNTIKRKVENVLTVYVLTKQIKKRKAWVAHFVKWVFTSSHKDKGIGFCLLWQIFCSIYTFIFSFFFFWGSLNLCQ